MCSRKSADFNFADVVLVRCLVSDYFPDYFPNIFTFQIRTRYLVRLDAKTAGLATTLRKAFASVVTLCSLGADYGFVVLALLEIRRRNSSHRAVVKPAAHWEISLRLRLRRQRFIQNCELIFILFVYIFLTPTLLDIRRSQVKLHM